MPNNNTVSKLLSDLLNSSINVNIRTLMTDKIRAPQGIYEDYKAFIAGTLRGDIATLYKAVSCNDPSHRHQHAPFSNAKSFLRLAEYYEKKCRHNTAATYFAITVQLSQSNKQTSTFHLAADGVGRWARHQKSIGTNIRTLNALIAENRADALTEGTALPRANRTAGGALETIRRHHGLAKVINTISYESLDFLFKQFSNPVHNRPRRKLADGVDREYVRNPATGEFRHRHVLARESNTNSVDYRPADPNEFAHVPVKKTATTLLPSDGCIPLFTRNGVGILFDARLCDESIYSFTGNMRTDDKWWVGRTATAHQAHTRAIPDLARENTTLRQSDQQRSGHTEQLISLTKASISAVFATNH